jgi:glycoside/pentoside/hexuronide:cation symporter, GPH family
MTNTTLDEDRVPLKAKVSFGLGNMVGNFMMNLTKELLPPVFVVALGASPALVGISIVIFRLYDAFLDPIIGWLSDNTRTRLGRRRPWMIGGALAGCLTMPLIWMVQADWSPTMQICWLIGAGMILFTVYSIYGVPYESFLLELTPDYKERTSVTSFKLAISSVSGLLIGWSWYITQLPFFSDPITGKPDALAGARGVAIVAGILILIFGLCPVIFAKERFYQVAKKQEKLSLKKNFQATFSNRPFLILVGVALCTVTGVGLINGLHFYTVLYYVCNGDAVLAAKLQGVQSTLWMPISIGAVFVFQAINNRWSKTHALYVAIGFCLLSAVSRTWTYTPDAPYLCLLSSCILAIGVTGMWQILPSMNADVVDDNELTHSLRMEGSFASIFSWFMKVGQTMAMGLPGVIVTWCGLIVANKTNQAPAILSSILACNVWLPTSLLLIALFLLAIYPLSFSRMGDIRRVLELRRGYV